MPVRVKRILNLASFKSARILAGEDYLDNIIKQVSISDSPTTEMYYEVSKQGDFYLSGFYFAKDSADDMYPYLQTLIDTGASGICLLDEYINDLPDEIKKFCDDNRLPVLIVNANVPYADMIKEIMELVILDQRNELISNQIKLLLSGNLNDKEKEGIIRSFNIHFHDNMTAIYIMTDEKDGLRHCGDDILDIFNRGILSFATFFDNGILGLISHATRSKDKIKDLVEYYTSEIVKRIPEAFVGVSSLSGSITKCNTSINQAIMVSEAIRNCIVEKNVMYYDDLGVLKLLILLSGKQESYDYIDEIITPILKYDEIHNTNLLETMSNFISNHRDPKATSEAMYIHTNTVRYRVEKARSLISVEQSMDNFLESFSIALQLYKISSRL